MFCANPKTKLNCSVDGVTPTVTGVMGTLQANEVMNSILKVNKLDKKMLIFDL